MAYPYGTRGAPTVGGGLPGLPRRRSRAVPPSAVFDLGAYRIITANNTGVRVINLATGETEAQYASPSNTSFFDLSVSHDQKYAIVSYEGSSSSRNGAMALLALPDLTPLSALTIVRNGETVGTGTARGVAIHSGLEMIAVGGYGRDRTSAVYTFQELLSGSGGTLDSLTPALTWQCSPTSMGNSDVTSTLRWNWQGDLIAQALSNVSGTASSGNGDYQRCVLSFGDFTPVLSIPSPAWAGASGAAATTLEFTNDGRALVAGLTYNVSSTTGSQSMIYKFDYSGGAYNSHELLWSSAVNSNANALNRIAAASDGESVFVLTNTGTGSTLTPTVFEIPLDGSTPVQQTDALPDTTLSDAVMSVDAKVRMCTVVGTRVGSFPRGRNGPFFPPERDGIILRRTDVSSMRYILGGDLA